MPSPFFRQTYCWQRETSSCSDCTETKQPLVEGPEPDALEATLTECHRGHGQMPFANPQNACWPVEQIPMNPQTSCWECRTGPVFHAEMETALFLLNPRLAMSWILLSSTLDFPREAEKFDPSIVWTHQMGTTVPVTQSRHTAMQCCIVVLAKKAPGWISFTLMHCHWGLTDFSLSAGWVNLSICFLCRRWERSPPWLNVPNLLQDKKLSWKWKLKTSFPSRPLQYVWVWRVCLTSPPPGDPIHHQVMTSWQFSPSLYLSIQDIQCPVSLSLPMWVLKSPSRTMELGSGLTVRQTHNVVFDHPSWVMCT